jgi:hypothetical protein
VLLITIIADKNETNGAILRPFFPNIKLGGRIKRGASGKLRDCIPVLAGS